MKRDAKIKTPEFSLFSLLLSGQALAQTLGSFCPSVLFPYAREAIDGVVIKGSFPALMLAPVNFDAVYAQAKAAREAQDVEIGTLQ